MTETLDNYDFDSVNAYMEALTKHITNVSKGKVTMTTLILGYCGDDEDEDKEEIWDMIKAM